MNETLGRVIRLLVTVPSEWLGLVCDVIEKLASDRGSEWYEELKKFAHREPCWVSVTKAVERTKVYLRRLSVGAMDITDGTETFKNSGLFTGGVYGETLTAPSEPT